MIYKSIGYIDDMLKTSELDQESKNVIIEKLNEMLAIAQTIPQMKAKSVSIFNRAPQWDPQRIGDGIIPIVENLRNSIINLIEYENTPQKEQVEEYANTAINDFNTVLFQFEKELSELPYDAIAEVSQALSSIRLIFNDFIYPILQEQESEKAVSDDNIDAYIQEVDPSLRKYIQRISVQPLIYEYKGHEIKVKIDKQGRPYFQIVKTDITSRSLKSIVNYLESMGGK